MVLLRGGATARVDAVEVTQVETVVYNFQVEGLHNYAVGQAGVLVHNSDPCEGFTIRLENGDLIEVRYDHGRKALYYIDVGTFWNSAPVYVGDLTGADNDPLVTRGERTTSLAEVLGQVTGGGPSGGWDSWFGYKGNINKDRSNNINFRIDLGREIPGFNSPTHNDIGRFKNEATKQAWDAIVNQASIGANVTGSSRIAASGSSAAKTRTGSAAGKNVTESGVTDFSMQVERAGAVGLGKLAGNTERHHLFPREFANEFRARGIDIEQFVIDLDKGRHRLTPDGIHTGPRGESWNGVWKKFFNDNARATRQDIFDQLTKMRKDFGV